VLHLDPAIEQYRIKITGLPMGTTCEELKKQFKNVKKGCFLISRNQTSTMRAAEVTAYLRQQPSEIKARDLIKNWLKQRPFPGFSIKYQLEIDQDDIDHYDIGDEMSDSARTIIPNDDIDPCILSQNTNDNSQLSQNEISYSTLTNDQLYFSDEEIGEYP
jgi:hypothetical protein